MAILTAQEAEEAGYVRVDASKVKFPALARIFRYKIYDGGRNRDLWCSGCGGATSHAKFDWTLAHAYRCSGVDQALKDELKRQQETSLNLPSTSVAASQIDSLVAELVSVRFLPINLVESSEFRQLVLWANPEYQLPSRSRLANTIISQSATRSRTELIRTLKSRPRTSLTIEFDGWTSRAGLALLAVVASDHLGRSLLIDLIDITADSHTANFLASVVIKSIENSGLPIKQFGAVVSDEASNCRKARALIAHHFKEVNLLEYRCMAHTYNLIGNRMSRSETMKPMLKRAADLITILNRCKPLWAKLKDLGARKISPATPTRWYSVSTAINGLIELKPLFPQVPKEALYNYERLEAER